MNNPPACVKLIVDRCKIMNEDLQLELEALQATYGDDAAHVETVDNGSEFVTVITLSCEPRADTAHECFVAANLVLKCPPDYPTLAPKPLIERPKGV